MELIRPPGHLTEKCVFTRLTDIKRSDSKSPPSRSKGIYYMVNKVTVTMVTIARHDNKSFSMFVGIGILFRIAIVHGEEDNLIITTKCLEIGLSKHPYLQQNIISALHYASLRSLVAFS